MITFACKEIDLKDLLVCSFSLNKTSYKVLLQLLKETEAVSAEDLAAHVQLDRTTVQKALKALITRNLASRKQMNLDTGGYQYFYKVDNKEELKRKMLGLIGEWTRKVEDEIKKW